MDRYKKAYKRYGMFEKLSTKKWEYPGTQDGQILAQIVIEMHFVRDEGLKTCGCPEGFF
jgi:hypothetical protein